MTAELIVVEGPLCGKRYELAADRILVGQSPDSVIRLDGGGAGWRHCEIRRNGRGSILIDLRSGSGTFLNGLRITEQTLEDGDQITIGDNVMTFRADPAERSPAGSSRTTLLRACTLMFLFKALRQDLQPDRLGIIETQILRIIADFLPWRAGFVWLAESEIDLRACARERGFLNAEALTAALLSEGAYLDPATKVIAYALYVRGHVTGALALELESPSTDAEDTVSAIATLASTALEGAREIEALKVEKALLQEQLEVGSTGIVGASPAIARLHQMIERVAPRDTTVLVLGESGTGKELVARAIHEQSARRSRPFVAINCAAITDTLLESELFGHEKGAFTGAVVQKKGKLELAEGGTVFLDEIGELAPGLQAKLLRVLQQREFERVGGTRTLRLDVRLIAATNRDLAAEVKHGAFREDLYHRLNVVALRTPALRDRREDVPLLARHFLDRVRATCGRRVNGISADAERCLAQYSWPGNVRELENTIERAVVLGESDMILPEDLPDTVLETVPPAEVAGDYHASLGSAKRDSVIRAWREAHGDYKAAARLLGLHPNSLLRLIRNLGIREVLEQTVGS